MTAIPRLSVIVASYHAQDTIAACLTSLEQQSARRDMQVIVVDSSGTEMMHRVAAGFAGIEWHFFPERKFCGDARNIGLRLARAEVVAFIDADCTVSPGWAASLLDAHAGNVVALGGAIANGDPESLVGWAAYFCEFSAWMPGTPRQEMDDVAGAHMSYKKKIFESLGYFIEGTYSSDSEFHNRLKKSGHRILFDPGRVVGHHSIVSWRRYLAHEFFHGRSFARVRAGYESFGFWRRWIYVMGFGVIFLKNFGGICAAQQRNRIYRVHFLKAWPLVALGTLFWVCGEAAGYAKGAYGRES